MPHMDAFNSDVFNMATLTHTLLDEPHIPRRVGDMGIFEIAGVPTTSISIERQQNTLDLVQTSARGAPSDVRTTDPRLLHNIGSVRLALEDAVVADEIQNLRAFGSETDVETLENEVRKRLLRLSNNIEATIEFYRLSALKGIVVDKDATALYTMADIFGVSLGSTVTFDWSDINDQATNPGLLRITCSGILRDIEDALGSLPYSSVHMFVGPTFFDNLTATTEFRAAQLNWARADELTQRMARRSVDFGGITFEEYRGTVGGTQFVADTAGVCFPVGVPGMYIERYCPAEYWDTVNTMGLPRYARQVNSAEPDVSRIFRIQSHPIVLVTRPGALIPIASQA